MRNFNLLLAFTMGICAAQVFQPLPITPPGTNSTPGVITGIVRGADGTTVSSGSIGALWASSSPKPRIGRSSASARIFSDGTFSLPPLLDGTYVICAQTPGTQWLNSCEWGGKGATVSIPSGKASSEVAVTLAKGALVTVRVNDPGQLLAANE